MTDFVAIVASLREQMQANLTRSDVLKALIMPISLCLLGILGNTIAKGPPWVAVLLAVALMLFFGLYFFAYVYCLIKDRDALRSEKYNMNKLALEHGVYGDSTRGLLDVTPNGTIVDNKPPQDDAK